MPTIPTCAGYTADDARKDFATRWLLYGDCIELVKKFGFTKWSFHQQLDLKKIEKKELAHTWTRYSREDIIKIFS
jgi:hypothetical protein